MCKLLASKRFKKKEGGGGVSGEWNKETDWSAEVLDFATIVMLKGSISPAQTNTERYLFKMKSKWQFKRLSKNLDLFRRCSF